MRTSGTRTVVDGAKTATLSLLGSYVTSDFALSTDSHGGTFVKFVCYVAADRAGRAPRVARGPRRFEEAGGAELEEAEEARFTPRSTTVSIRSVISKRQMTRNDGILSE